MADVALCTEWGLSAEGITTTTTLFKLLELIDQVVATDSCPLFLLGTVYIPRIEFIDRVLVILDSRRSQIACTRAKQDFLSIQIFVL